MALGLYSLEVYSFILLVVLLANARGQSCDNTRVVFQGVQNLNGPGASSSNVIFTSFQPLAGSVCQLGGTCCSSEAETAFTEEVAGFTENSITDHLQSQLSLCHNHSIFGETANYIRRSRSELVRLIKIVYPLSSGSSTLFDRFYDYLANTVHTGDLSELSSEFNQVFFEVFLVSVLDNPSVPSFPNTPEVHQCFYNFFEREKGPMVQDWLNGFQRAYNLTMRYFRALRVMDRVVEAVVTRHQLSAQCKLSLMKMSHCAHCAGYSSTTQSCNGLCVNTMRGCLLDLGELVEPIQSFSQALIALKDLALTFDTYHQINLLNSNVFNLIDSTFESLFPLLADVNTCINGGSNRRKREAGSEGRPRETRNAPRSTIPAPSDSFNSSAYCLLNSLGLFSSLPNFMCNREGVTAANSDCWNGRLFGSYSRSVLEFTRSEQVNNPEVLVCAQSPSQFAQEVKLLRYMTREMNTLTGICSPDDEDCLEVEVTSRYYNLGSIEFSSVEDLRATQSPGGGSGEGGSGSGSGDDQRDLCSRVPLTTAVPPATAEPDMTVGIVNEEPGVSSAVTPPPFDLVSGGATAVLSPFDLVSGGATAFLSSGSVLLASLVWTVVVAGLGCPWLL